jgi:glycosyltransferase involved in cell wall biosynthesis
VGADARAVRRLRRLLPGADLPGADVVHAHGLRAGLLAGLALDHRRYPAPDHRRYPAPDHRRYPALVVTWHNRVLGGAARRAAYAVLERIVARHADVTLGASPDLVTRARALGARDARFGPVAAPPLPPPARPPGQVRATLGAAQRPLVLAVGRLHPQKGFDTLVAAAARWARRTPPPLVAIAGDGPARGALAAAIAASGAPVRLLGRRDDVADLLAAADVVVLSSVWEARALVAQEALRAGRPLVATAVGGVPDLVGDAAVLVPAGSVEALAGAVAGLLDDPAAARVLAHRGPARAAEWPDEQDTAEQVAAVYRELCP